MERVGGENVGQISVTRGNDIEKEKKKRQEQAVLDAQELAISNDEINIDLTDLIMAQSEKIDLLEEKIRKLEGGSK